MEKKRLSKALAAAGIASRRACEELIFAGRVQVNDQTIKVPQTLVDWEHDKILVDGEKVRGEEKKLYYILNKPKGFICSNERVGNKPIIIDLFERTERLFTVGRLDKDTSGLLIVTNDGAFANRVIHPSSNIVKEYLVRTEQEITALHLKALSRGARVDEKWVRPVSVHKVRRGTFKIAVKEGKKHEVRILAEKVGLRIVELIRIRIGSLVLGPLPEGKFMPMSEKDRALIFAQ
ncbi:MAG: rRNA pseudouridine synthase [Chlamydiia bacterium]|nr:rRNA pseudouridine synthase [Chlamydiia bacterium]